jgi:hypothetical protein
MPPTEPTIVVQSPENGPRLGVSPPQAPRSRKIGFDQTWNDDGFLGHPVPDALDALNDSNLTQSMPDELVVELDANFQLKHPETASEIHQQLSTGDKPVKFIVPKDPTDLSRILNLWTPPIDPCISPVTRTLNKLYVTYDAQDDAQNAAQDDAQNLVNKVSNIDQVTNDPWITDNIRLTDVCDKYRVYHYSSCDEQSDPKVKHTRGTIRCDNGIVCSTFGYTPEYVADPQDTVLLNKLAGLPNKSYYLSEEGTLIRVWFHGHAWHFSSHKKCDAFHSRWGSRKSHGEMFVEALTWYVNNRLKDKLPVEDPDHLLDAYLATLNQERVYTFIVRTNQDNRIVCNPLDHPMLYFAGEFNDLWVLLEENTSMIERPIEITMTMTIAEESPNYLVDLLNTVNSLDPYKAQGVTIYYNAGNLDFGCVKLVSSKYQALADLRGNCPSILFRYLQVRNDDTSVAGLLELYPEYYSYIAGYEMLLNVAAEEIYNGYVARFIQRKYIVLPQEIWFAVKDLHDLFFQDPIANKISSKLIASYIKGLSAVKLNKMIRGCRERLVANLDDGGDWFIQMGILKA